MGWGFDGEVYFLNYKITIFYSFFFSKICWDGTNRVQLNEHNVINV